MRLGVGYTFDIVGRAEEAADTAGKLTAELLRRGLPRLPVGVGIRYDSVAELPEVLGEEAEVLGPRAAERRRRLFALGRAAARDALAELGIAAVAIGRGAAGEPLWPPGIVGAISHNAAVAVAVVGRRTDYLGLGVDVEERGRGLSERAMRMVCRPSEAAWVDDGGFRSERLLMLFSAKEAVFKAVFPVERVWLGFGDAELTWKAARCAFEARLLKAAAARLPVGSTLEVHCSLISSMVLSTTFCLA